MSTAPAPPTLPPADSARPAIASTAYWNRLARDAFVFRWSGTTGRAALTCLPVIAAWLVGAVLIGGYPWGMFAVAGAVSASFGAFQRLGDNRLRPTLALLFGNALFTFAGNAAGHFGWLPWIVLATIAGFAFGAMTALGYGGWWLGLQWMIAILAFGSHAAPPPLALQYALAVAAGGVTQVFFLRAARRFSERWFTTQDQPPWDPVDSLTDAFLYHANPVRPAGGYAVRVAVAMAVSAIVWHLWRMPNGYWTPMTVAILLKPDFHEVAVRGAGRLAGTLIGAGLVTLLVALLRPSPPLLALMLLASIGGCLALLRVNYALFATCVTSYVVLLLSTLGLPEPVVALRRVEATLAGAAIALAVWLIPIHAARPQTQSATDLHR